MAIPHHADGPRVHRYFTGKNVGFLTASDIVGLTTDKRPDFTRTWSIHKRGGWRHLNEPEDRAKIQLLDLLVENGELEEFTVQAAPLPEEKPGLEIPEFRR